MSQNSFYHAAAGQVFGKVPSDLGTDSNSKSNDQIQFAIDGLIELCQGRTKDPDFRTYADHHVKHHFERMAKVIGSKATTAALQAIWEMAQEKNDPDFTVALVRGAYDRVRDLKYRVKTLGVKHKRMLVPLRAALRVKAYLRQQKKELIKTMPKLPRHSLPTTVARFER